MINQSRILKAYAVGDGGDVIAVIVTAGDRLATAGDGRPAHRQNS